MQRGLNGRSEPLGYHQNGSPGPGEHRARYGSEEEADGTSKAPSTQNYQIRLHFGRRLEDDPFGRSIPNPYRGRQSQPLRVTSEVGKGFGESTGFGPLFLLRSGLRDGPRGLGRVHDPKRCPGGSSPSECEPGGPL